MPSVTLRAKIIQHAQKKKFIAFSEYLGVGTPDELEIEALYFPASSEFINNIVKIRESNPTILKDVNIFSKELALKILQQHISMLMKESVLLCLFPNFSIMDKMAISDFPVMKINGVGANILLDKALQLSDFLHVFLCATVNYEKGVFFDVCAGDPELSGSDAPIYNIYVWGK